MGSMALEDRDCLSCVCRFRWFLWFRSFKEKEGREGREGGREKEGRARARAGATKPQPTQRAIQFLKVIFLKDEIFLIFFALNLKSNGLHEFHTTRPLQNPILNL
jgi:hypothetical protein